MTDYGPTAGGTYEGAATAAPDYSCAACHLPIEGDDIEARHTDSTGEDVHEACCIESKKRFSVFYDGAFWLGTDDPMIVQRCVANGIAAGVIEVTITHHAGNDVEWSESYVTERRTSVRRTLDDIASKGA
jgi:hypothetical protein